MPNPPSTQSVCPTCGSKNPTQCRFQSGAMRSHEHASQRGEPGCCPDPFHSPDTQTEERCCCCGKPAPNRGDSDPWQGRMDAYCENCAETRCDAYPGACRKSAPPDPQGQVEERWTVVICKRCRQAIPGATEYACHGMHRRGKTVEVVPASRLDQAERRAEEAKAEASEANHQANMMSRNLQAANALAASYRDVGERMLRMTINGALCQDDEDACPLCREMWADLRKLLNPPSTSEGDA